MKYTISYKEPHKHFIDIEYIVEGITDHFTYLQLSAWRPGRYELSNYSRNIQKFEVTDLNNQPVSFKKTKKETWKVDTVGLNAIKVKYNYYAAQLDAGGSWLDEEQLYINFINCLLYVPGRENEACQVTLLLPDSYRIACGLKKNGKVLYAKDFYEVVDCPMIASATIQQQSYQAKGYTFTIWMQGNSEPDWNRIISEFKKFTDEQLEIMGDFPEQDYHFLFQMLPYKQHHGVEHRNSTIITLGPAEQINSKNFLNEFFSISCHELFHAWNIVKIRPAEMLPYDFTKENYFRTGFVAEGITTYYGEFLLARAGVFSEEDYFTELNGVFKKHFENYGRFNLSVAESSFDLWVDGYVQGIPDRKVSIYGKGALIALIFDIEIRKATHNAKSLDDAMLYLYNDFAKKNKGYTIEDIRTVLETVAGTSFKELYEELVFGVSPIEARLNNALNYLGCELEEYDTKPVIERVYGLKIIQKDGKTIADYLEPGSPADSVLTKDDEIIAVDSVRVANNINDLVVEKKLVTFSIFRRNKLMHLSIQAGTKAYFRQYKISKRKNAGKEEKENFQKWLKKPF